MEIKYPLNHTYNASLEAIIKYGNKILITASQTKMKSGAGCGSGGFALLVERSFEVASPNTNVIFQADSNAVDGIKDGFTIILDLVLKQLEHLNTTIDELDKQKDIPENCYKISLLLNEDF
ncbi:hypothetical protein CDAR_431551 [Caerostris darwini]|uniref:FeS cluster biogenesis domain-containing protein n=1 Tax=Caerostris darwini TaxID=1538125 RepID=A0AAV4QSI6_9ARAC|nr:hypothetical protein CDAR_431551 [Caerostris darwini]